MIANAIIIKHYCFKKLPLSSAFSILQSTFNGLLALPVTLCLKCAMCLASNVPFLAFPALFSKSARVNSQSSTPVFGNTSTSGFGDKENFFVDHFNHDLICFDVHSTGSRKIII